MYPQDQKRTTYMYNDLEIQLVGPGQYSEHPDYEYLEGRKLEDVYPTGEFQTFGSSFRMLPESVRTIEAELRGDPSFIREDKNRSLGK